MSSDIDCDPKNTGNALSSFPHHGLGFHPLGEDIGRIKRMYKLPITRFSAVRDQISFEITKLLDIPMIGLDRNLMPQQSSRLGPTVNLPFQPASVK